MTGTKVLITCRQMQSCIDEFRGRLADAGLELTLPEVVQQPTEDELIAIIGDYDGMIAGDDPLTAQVLAHAGRMRVISKWGVGTDGIDLGAAAQGHIVVSNTPNVFGDEVADVAIGMVIMVARQLHQIHTSVAAGGWWKHEGRSLSGATLGVVGLGSVGQAVVRRGLGFGMRIVGSDPVEVSRDAATVLGVEVVPLDEVFRLSDFTVLCCPLTPENRHMVNSGRLASVRQGAALVNVARGGLVDENALIDALESGRLSAAGLDVFENEPLSASHRLRQFPQCVFGSHNGSNTREAVMRASGRAVDNLLSGLGIT